MRKTVIPLVTTAVLTTIALGAGPAAQAAEPVPGPAGPPAEITLLTGEKIRPAKTADGRTLSTVDTFRGHISTVNGQTYAIPLAAFEALRSGSVDRELFNITARRTDPRPTITVTDALGTRSETLTDANRSGLWQEVAQGRARIATTGHTAADPQEHQVTSI